MKFSVKNFLVNGNKSAGRIQMKQYANKLHFPKETLMILKDLERGYFKEIEFCRFQGFWSKLQD